MYKQEIVSKEINDNTIKMFDNRDAEAKQELKQKKAFLEYDQDFKSREKYV